jgi:glycosyltransferase involved in cell wall biosynthesis
VALYVGRIAPEKNVPLAFEAYREMARVRDVRFVVVGDGPERERLARQHADAVFAGFRSGADLAAHYASADVFLFPSLSETFGNVTLEAMASGLAVVAFADAAAAEHIVDGRSGRLAPRGDTAAFVRAARRLAEDAASPCRLGRNARAHATRVGWDVVHDTLEHVLLEVIEQGKPHPAVWSLERPPGFSRLTSRLVHPRRLPSTTTSS